MEDEEAAERIKRFLKLILYSSKVTFYSNIVGSA
jgi:hypothetical protein